MIKDLQFRKRSPAGASFGRLRALEQQIGAPIPAALREFLSRWNGGFPSKENAFYHVPPEFTKFHEEYGKDNKGVTVDGLYGLTREPRGCNLVDEHVLLTKVCALGLIPIAFDLLGNQVVLQRDSATDLVFWRDHELWESSEQPHLIPISGNLEHFYNSLTFNPYAAPVSGDKLMAIEDLINIMQPPAAPIEARGAAWASVESDIGTALPADYKAFIEKYGSGRINAFVWIFNPLSNRPGINLVSQMSVQLNALKTLAQDFGEQCPYALFPENGGLLPLGVTDNGDVIHWLTKGEPADWRIVVNEGRGQRYEEFDSNLTSFLRRILTRDTRCSLLPPNFPQGAPSFEPK